MSMTVVIGLIRSVGLQSWLLDVSVHASLRSGNDGLSDGFESWLLDALAEE
jgi:exosome complex RNA-binding protein Rrp4